MFEKSFQKQFVEIFIVLSGFDNFASSDVNTNYCFLIMISLPS